MSIGWNIVSDNETPEVLSMDENIGAMLYIMLGRVYDMLLLIADGQGKGDDAMKLLKLHQQGQLMCPPPALSFDDLTKSDEEDTIEPQNNE